MSPTTDRYDELYGRLDEAFGAEPDSLLVEHRRLLDPTRPVLDVGAGQGRHSLLLAAEGFTVEAIDPSPVAIESLRARAKEAEEIGPEHRHGDGPVERHARATAVLRRRT